MAAIGSAFGVCGNSTMARQFAQESAFAPFRIAYIVHTFEMGGLERCIARLANHLDRTRFRPYIVCLNRTGAAQGWVEATDVPLVEFHKRAGNDPAVVWRLARWLRQERIHCVHSHNWGTLAETVIARRLARVPRHVHAEHGQELADLRLGGWKRRLRSYVGEWALRRTDRVVVVTDSIRDRLAGQHRLDHAHVELIGNGVDSPGVLDPDSTRARLRASLGISPHEFLIGSVGRLAPVKDFHNAVRALALLNEQRLPARLAIVGSGPEQDAILAAARAAGVGDRVHLVGQQTNVGEWLSSFDVYVNSSLSEGMSLGILEAMAAGLPQVVTAVGESPRLVLGETPEVDACGLVIPPAESAALAAALERLYLATDLRLRYALAARSRFERVYQTARMVDRYQALYLDLLEDQPRRSSNPRS